MATPNSTPAPKNTQSPYAGKKATAKKASTASPYKKGAATPKAAEPNPIVSAGQAIIGAISAPLAGVTGFLNESIRQDKTGEANLVKRLTAGAENFGNSVTGKPTVFTQDILRTLGTIGPKGSGAPLEEGSAGAFVAGLAGDIALDPTNLIPGKVLLSGAKIANTAAKTTIRTAADTLMGGETSLARAIKTAPAEAEALTKAAVTKPVAKKATEQLYKAGQNVQGATTAAGETYRKAMDTITAIQPKVVKLDKPQGIIQAVGDAVATALEAGKAAAVTQLTKERAVTALESAAKAENKAIRANKNFATATYEGAPGATVDAVKSTQTPLASGKAIEFPKFTPYKAENGKTYVSDGEKAYSFPTEKEARQYIASTGNTAAKTVSGADPIFDVAPTAIPLPSMLKIPTTAPEAKAAQKSLKLIESLAKTAEATIPQGRGKKAAPVTYSGFTDLVAGLKAGHSVDYASLTKIIDALDPSRQWVKGVEGLSQKRATQFVSDLLTTAGVQTAAKVQERLDLMNAHTILKGQGVAFSDFAATYLTLKLSQSGQEALAAAVDAETLASAIQQARSAAAQRIYEADINPIADSLGKQLDRVTNAVNRAFTKRISDVKNITDQKKFWEEITNMGDLAVRTTEKAWDADSRAILKLQLNQSYQAGLIGSLLGLVTYREGKKIASAFDKGMIAIEGTPKERMLRFISDMKLSEDTIVATLGSRLVHIRVQNPNLPKQLAPNFVYLHLGDIMETFTETGKGNLIEEAFFPTGAGIERTTDSMSYSGIVEAARHILEMQQLNKNIVKADVVRMILSRAKGQTTPSAEFLARTEKLANKMADHMLDDTRVAEMLTQTHKSRLIAASDEALASAETLTRDLWDNMVAGMEANMGKGYQSEIERVRLVKDLFNKFIYLSGAFKAQSTEVGESVLRAAAMVYINDGKLFNILKEKGYVGEKLIATSDEARSILETLNNMFKVEGPAKVSRTLNGVSRKATPEQVDKVISNYSEAVLKYDKVRNALAEVTDAKSMTAWQKKFDTAQKALTNSRARMDKLGYPTQHWTPEGWIPSEDYNIALVRQAAGETTILDTPVVPKPRALNKKQQAAIYEEYVMKNIAEQISLRASEGEEAATSVLARIADIEAQRPEDVADQAQAIYQQYVSETLHAGETKTTRAKLTDENIFVGQAAYGKTSPTKLSPEAQRTFAQRAKEIWNGPSGRELSNAYLIESQSRLNNAVQSVARSMQILVDKYVKVLGKEDFHTAFTLAAGKTIPKGTTPELAELALDLRSAIDAFFGPNGAIVTSGLDGKSIQSAFERFGLGNVGIPNVADWTAERLQNLIKESPFGAAPKPDGTNALQVELFNKQRQLLEASERNPLLVMSSMIQAIEHAKMEKHITQTWHNEFGYMTQFAHIADPVARYNKAVAEGWVSIKLLGGTTNLAEHLPSPTKGGLYHPAMAKEFASMNREYNRLYNSKQMPKFVQAMMEVTNVLKFTQTVLNPRHHVLNNLGDITTAVIGGARNPADWLKASQLSLEAAVENAEIDYASIAKWKGKDQYELSLARSMRHLQPKNAADIATPSDATPLDAVIGGRRVAFTNKDFIELARSRGAIVSQQFINDQRLLSEGLQAYEAAGSKGELFRTALEKTREGIAKVERPLGDFAAAYGNAPRLATAITVMKSRSWTSEREMWDAISNKVHLLHPTTLSLSATERRYPRLLASYYTWIRGAHNAFIYMALNHTAATTVYSKAQYNAAETQGLDPLSIGTPWANKALTPGYLDYSVYGPTTVGPNGPVLFKPGILPLDVIDTWNVQFDPTIPFSTNAIQNVQGLGQSVIGKNINMLLQPGLELVTRTDPATGKPTQIKDLASLGDKAASMFGPTQLLKGLGLYTPANKGPDSANPLTPRQRQIALENWLGLTQKAQDINSPANVKNAQAEESARQQRILDNLLKNQGQK